MFKKIIRGWLIRAHVLILVMLPVVVSNAASVDEKLKTFRDCDQCSEMVIVPSGSYMMGATESEFVGQNQYEYMHINETPRHRVDVMSFAIARYAITRKQFSVFASETGFVGKGCLTFNGNRWIDDEKADWSNPGFHQTDRDPAVCISWTDAQLFLKWINTKKDPHRIGDYRLPTEEEWEYAARAGTVGPMYWGSDRSQQCEFENGRDMAAEALDPSAPHVDCNDGFVETAPVGSFKPNPWGLYDMLGNTSQWLSDCPNIGYSAPPIVTFDAAAPECPTRAMRGGSWATIPIGVRSANRQADKPKNRASDGGFRLAIDYLTIRGRLPR